MITPGNLPLVADRWTPFDMLIDFTGLDLTSATMEAHIRPIRDGAGTPLVDLDTTGTPGAQGLRLVGVDTTGDEPVSTVAMRISEATVEGLPAASEQGDDAELYWDMQITPSGGVKQVYLRGTFTVRAGVTH